MSILQKKSFLVKGIVVCASVAFLALPCQVNAENNLPYAENEKAIENEIAETDAITYDNDDENVLDEGVLHHEVQWKILKNIKDGKEVVSLIISAYDNRVDVRIPLNEHRSDSSEYDTWWATEYNEKIDELIIQEGITEIGETEVRYSDTSSYYYEDDDERYGMMTDQWNRGYTAPFEGFTNLKSVSLPESLVTIGDRTFKDCSKLESIEIPDNVMIIGRDAFNGCTKLSNADISTNLTLTVIGSRAFKNCSKLVNITLPDSLKAIFKESFYNCSEIKNITIPLDVTYIGDSAFYGCDGITNIAIPLNVTNIADNTFYGCSGITNITLSQGLTSIGDSAFYGCSGITNITIPQSVERIENSAFYNCVGITSVTIPENVYYIGARAFYNCKNLKYLVFKSNGLTNINAKTFEKCAKIERIIFPADVNAVGEDAFRDCTNLRVITVPWENFSADATSFANCNKLTDVYENMFYFDYDEIDGEYKMGSRINNSKSPEIQNATKHVGFIKIKNVPTVMAVGDHIQLVPYIEEGSGLENDNINFEEYPSSDGICSIDENWMLTAKKPGKYNISVTTSSGYRVRFDSVFVVDPNLIGSSQPVVSGVCGGNATYEIYVPDKNGFSLKINGSGKTETTQDWGDVSNYVDAIKTITVSTGITEIGDYMFSSFWEVTSLSLGEGLTSIGENSFEYMKRLTDITLPETVSSIGSNSFNNSGLKAITIPNTVKSIGESAFSNCFQLTDVQLPENIIALNISLFANCPQLESIVIPVGVSSLGNDAFSGCSRLESVTIPKAVKTISTDRYPFKDCNNLKNIYFEGSKVPSTDQWENYGNLRFYENIITPDEKAPTKMKKGDTYECKIKYREGSGLVLSGWESSDPDVLTIDENGKITAVAPGKAIVTAVESHGYNYEYPEIEVVGNITLTGEKEKLEIEETMPLTVTWPKDTEELPLIWTSSDNEIATVSEKGIVTAVSAGTVVITAKTEDEAFSAEIELEVLGALSISSPDTRLLIGDTMTLTAVWPKNTESKPVSWTSSNNSVATISDKGVVTGVSKGKVVITVKTENNEYSAEIALEIYANESESSGSSGKDTELSDVEAEFDEANDIHYYDVYTVKGMTYQLPDGKTWTSENKSYVTVSKNNLKAVNSTYGNNIVRVFDGYSLQSSKNVYRVRVAVPYIKYAGSPVNKLTMTAGDAYSLNIGGISTDANMYNVSWESLNREIAEVQNGNITAYAKGSVTINAYVSGKKLSCSVKVTDVQTNPKKLDNNATIMLSPLQTMSVKFSNSLFSVKSLVWDSEKHDLNEILSGNKIGYYQNSVVRVTPAGKLTAVGIGETTLTAVDRNGYSQTVTVKVNPPAVQNVHINLNKSKTIKFYNVKANVAIWNPKDSTIIGAAYGGKINGIKAGQTVLTCYYDPYNTGTPIEYKANISVENPKLVIDDVSKWSKVNAAKTGGTLSLGRGTVYNLKLDGIYQDVSFTSNKPAVAFIDENGEIKARRTGKASLTAKINGQKITVNVIVY